MLCYVLVPVKQRKIIRFLFKQIEITYQWQWFIIVVSVSTKTPRSNQKRVARLDKIMNDMVRHKRIDDEAAMSEQLNQASEASPIRPT